MRLKYSLPIVLLILVPGCSSNRKYSSFEEINQTANHKTVTIELQDGNRARARNLRVTRDSTYWIDANTDEPHQLHSSQNIRKVIVINRRRGAWLGFRNFMFAGTALGVIGLYSGDDSASSEMAFTAADKFLLGISAGFVYGVVIGVPTGALIGAKDVFVIDQQHRDALKNEH